MTSILHPGVAVYHRLVMGIPMQNEPQTATLERRVVTLTEAAVMLRISRGLAYEAAKRGEIPTIRIGRRLLVPIGWFDGMPNKKGGSR